MTHPTPPFGPINHIGVAVPSLSAAVQTYRALLGATVISDVIDLPAQGVRVQFLDTPNSQIELLEPLGETSPVRKFLQANPKGGQHHICFEDPDVTAAKARLEAQGVQVLGEPRIGAHGTKVIFIHPKHMHGVLVELMEPAAEH